MKIEQLAKQMREQALTLKGYNPEEIRAINLEHEAPINRNQELKQLYFHAGRWVGGARDYGARMAYQAYLKVERPAKIGKTPAMAVTTLGHDQTDKESSSD